MSDKKTDLPAGFILGPPARSGRYVTITRPFEGALWQYSPVPYAQWTVQDGLAWYRCDPNNAADQRYGAFPREDHYTSGNWMETPDQVAHRPQAQP